MKKGGLGGSKTLSGLRYEEKTDLSAALVKIPGYTIESSNLAGRAVLYNHIPVARIFRKTEFYKFLDEKKINWKTRITKRLLPDDALLVIVRETLFIIEVKFQAVAGSVDEKLQTCDFKRKQYVKLVNDLGLKVEYVYVLSNWFKDPSYKDVLDYIHSVGCHYKFDEIPLAWLGLPSPHSTSDVELISEV